MPLDPSVLLQAQVPQLPNPLDLAGKGLTLGNLANANQMGNMQIQQMQAMVQALQDPRYGSIAGALIGGGQGGGGQPGQMPQPGAGQQPDMGSFISDYARAGPGLTENLLKMGSEAATIRQLNAKAELERAQGFVEKIKPLGGMAQSLAQNPTNQDTFNTLANNISDAGLTKYFNTPSVMADAPTRVAWANSVAAAVTDPDKLVTMTSVAAKTPGEVSALAWKNALSQQELGLNPQKVAIEQQQANAASKQAAAHYLNVTAPKVGPENVEGFPTIYDRFAPGGPTVSVAAGAGGAPAPQMKLNPGQSDLMTKFANVVATQAPVVQKSVDLQQQVMRLKALDDQGIYNGPLGASKLWKDVTGVLAPFMSPEDRAKVENSQAFGAEANTIVGTYMSQIMGSRMSQGALRFGQGTKPSDAMQPGARAMLWPSMYNGAQRNIDYWNQASDYAANPANQIKGPGGFQPQFRPDMPVPSIAGPRSTITPSQTGGFTVTDPNGKTHPFDTESQAMEFKSRAGML